MLHLYCSVQNSNNSFPPFHNETGRWLSKSCSKSSLHTLRFVSTHVIKYCLCFKCPKISFGWLQSLGEIYYALLVNVPKQKCNVIILNWSHVVSFSSVQLWPLTQAHDVPQKIFFDQESSPSRPIKAAAWAPVCDCLCDACQCVLCDSGHIPSFSSLFPQEFCMGNAVLLSLFLFIESVWNLSALGSLSQCLMWWAKLSYCLLWTTKDNSFYHRQPKAALIL